MAAFTPMLVEREVPWMAEEERRLRAHVLVGRCRKIAPLDQLVT